MRFAATLLERFIGRNAPVRHAAHAHISSGKAGAATPGSQTPPGEESRLRWHWFGIAKPPENRAW
jgi:hypothetical protein